jgi:hypothetical protein
MALNFPDSPTLNQVYTDSTSGFSYQWNGTVWISYTPSSSGNIRTLDDISASFNGTTQTFPLTSLGISVTPANPQSLIINLGGVVQDPTDDYTISGSNIIFSDAPVSGLSFSGILLGVAVPVGVSTGDVYFRQTYFPIGVQTSFVFINGYTSGYLDIYKNGVKLLGSTDYTATDGINFSLTPAAQLGDEIEAIGYRVSSISIVNGENLNRLNVSNGIYAGGITTSLGGFVGNLTGTASNATYATTSGIATYAITAGVATVSQNLTGSPNISVSGINNTGITTSADFRLTSIAEKTTIINGNTVNLVYNTGGGNVAICTNPTGNITLNVTGIPTDSNFNNNSLSFSVIVQNTGTARSCTAVTLNGVSETILWFGGSLSAALTGVTTSTGYDIYSFVGINTIGSAATTSNYIVLGNVNGGYR